MMKKLIACLLLAALLLSLLPAALAAQETKITYTGTVKEGSLHLRKTPSATGKVLNTYKKGTQVDILENDGTWCKVQIGKRTGYMMASYLEIKANYPHVGWGATKDDGTVINVRSEESAGASILYKAMSGGVFEVTGESKDWYQVRVGDQFGYLEKSALTVTDGEFALGFSAKADQNSVTVARMHSALREIGSPMTMSRAEGDFTFSITYPDLGIEAADSEISRWTQQIRMLFETDLRQNHPGSQGSLTVEYQALKINSRYESVTLMGEYKVGSLSAEAFLTLNIDAQEGALIPTASLFARNTPWALFCLESGISSLMSTPTDGYAGKPAADWLQYAALGRTGLEFYLPAGRYVPAALGSRKVDVTYFQLADCLGLDDAFMAQYRRVIDPAKPMLALTFDDGPSEETDKIVSVLAQYNARATFCVIGNKVESFSDVLKRTVAHGNEIASHTWTHPHLDQLSVASIRSQLSRTSAIVQEVSGFEIKALRPPYGAVNKNVRNVCKDQGLFIITWNIDTLDWKNRNTNKTYNAIVKGAKNGNIILMHDLYSTTAAAVEKAVPVLVEKGFQLVTVSELLAYHKDGIKTGTVYSNLDPKNMKTE
ncbi:MAG: polysaccharide deacetylase family protein [Clostridia bacterium]|nr:polysaccharide deacetylase family protein [Clostridia bacterium]